MFVMIQRSFAVVSIIYYPANVVPVVPVVPATASSSLTESEQIVLSPEEVDGSSSISVPGIVLRSHNSRRRRTPTTTTTTPTTTTAGQPPAAGESAEDLEQEVARAKARGCWAPYPFASL
jgi:hypothetical protein